MQPTHPPDLRVLVLAPVGRDGPVTVQLLGNHGIDAAVCADSAEACRQLATGAGALLLTEEALELPGAPGLLEHLRAQPPWSELPLIILTRGGESRLARLLDLTAQAAGALTLLERPLGAATLLRTVEVALRSRRRQYQVRDLNATLEARVAERTAALQESEARFRALVEDQTEIMSRFRADGTLLFVNEVYCRFFGKPAGELLHRKWQPVAHPEDVPRIEAALRALSPGCPVVVIENRVSSGTGEVRWVQFVNRGFFDAQGQLQEVQSVGRDITERKRLEAERAAMLVRLSAVEEQERRRLSRELHDQTAQRIVALAVELKTLEGNLAAGRLQGERVTALRQAVDDLQQEVREIAWGLRAGEPLEGDLESALRQFIEEWSERTHVPVDCECRGVGGDRLPLSVATPLYRLVKEALSNVEKHAQARHASVLLERDAALVRLTVEDDGGGFDVEAIERSGGTTQRLGLLGMKERVALAGGTFLIESSPGSGTTVLARIPIPAEFKPS